MVYDYNCLMINFDLDWWEDFVTNLIDPNDIYDNEQGEYGLETEPHVTVLFGLLPDIKFEYLKNRLPNLFKLAVTFTTINSFNNEDFDVLKLTAYSEELHKLHQDIKKNFDNNYQFITYNPHMTIAYLKPGTARKYHKTFSTSFSLVPNYYKFSYTDDSVVTFDPNKQLVEKIAELEHEQWMSWAKSVMDNENLSYKTQEKWDDQMVPYEYLSEEQKDKDREWADKVIDIIYSVYR